jgi:hypothetical protein
MLRKNERTIMNHQFDELAKTMAQSVTRRTALKKLGIGMGLLALAALGLPNRAVAVQGGNVQKLPGRGEPCMKVGKNYLCQPGLVCRSGPLVGYQHICL